MFFKRFLSYVDSLFSQPRVYLDYASSTPVDKAMISSFPSIPKKYAHANPSALHKEGVGLSRVLHEARMRCAKALGAHPDEIIFTANATESDNLALSGTINSFLKQGIKHDEITVYTSAFEHAAVNACLRELSSDIHIETLQSEQGIVQIKPFVVSPLIKVVLVSVLYVQNEIGTVQPIKEIAKYVRKIKKDFPHVQTVFHVDATQAPLFYDLNVARLGVDMMTIGSTKLYCPKGVGMLYKKKAVSLRALMFGGGQEQGLRPGTVPVELTHTFSYALEHAQLQHEILFKKISALQAYFESKLTDLLPRAVISSQSQQRAPHITHITIQGVESDVLILELDARGIAVSSKSACKNDSIEKSGNDTDIVELLYPGEFRGSVRCSFGKMTTIGDLDVAIRALQAVLFKYTIASQLDSK